MGEAYGRIGGVHSLPSGTGRAEEVEPYVVPAEVHVELSGLGEHGHGSGRSLDTSLGLGLGNPLHAVHAGLVFHDPVHAVAAAELEHYLLEASGSSGCLVGDLYLPAPRLGEMLVHAEKVAREDRCLVAAGTATDLDYRVLGIVGVGGNQQQLYLLLLPGNAGLELRSLLPGHLAELLVLFVDEYVLGRGEVVYHFLIFLSCRYDRFEFLVVLVELHVFLHVRHRLGTRKLVLKRLELVL